MNRFRHALPLPVLLAFALFLSACGGGGSSSGGGGNQNPTTPTVTVKPASSTITTAQTLAVTITVTGSGIIPSGTVILSSGSYTSAATALTAASASITIPAAALAVGPATLTAHYTPDSASSAAYNAASGTASITVSPAVTAPTITVSPALSTIFSTQSLSVSVSASGSSGTPTGAIVLTSGTYTSASTTLGSGSSRIIVPPTSLTTGAATLTATYTPDAAGSAHYKSATGTATVTVTAGTSTSVTVSIDSLANRHSISPYVYGGNVSAIGDSGTTLARWGGNASTTYNWKLKTYNADADYYYSDYGLGGTEPDSVQFVSDMIAQGSHPLTTMNMIGWVARESESSSNHNWSYSVATYGAQCSTDPYNADAGNGLKTDCSTPVTTSAVTSAYYPILDTTSQACPSGNCLYRDAWTKALATAFGSATCSIPYSTINSCHFYDMDNEVDIWGGTHRDVHPTAAGYDELANTYVSEAASVKSWDPAAVRFGPVSCCWWYYWNVGPAGDDKTAHAGIDFLPWWLNQVNWLDQVHGSRTLDVFDIHAYPDANTSGLTTTQLQALSADIYRDYWDPTYVSTSGVVNQPWATSTQPNKTIPFRIPRFKAMVNAIYPGTPLAFTEWSAAFYKETDFSTALGDADAYGIFGREGLSFATRWVGPVSPNPNYQALKLFTNYDGAHHAFGTTSAASSTNSNLVTSYAALNSAGTAMTVLVVNKDPKNAAQTVFNLSGFTPSSYTAYTLSSTVPDIIVASASAAWTANQTFAPYSITLLVITGTQAAPPASEWSLNPDDLEIPASGTATLHPAISSGTANLTLSTAVFDTYQGAPACTGTLTITNAAVTPTQSGAITVAPGATPGFCHYTVTGSDGAATQTQGGWVIVMNPAATLTQTGNNQTAATGSALAQPLTVTLHPGASGVTTSGAAILFTTSAGTLSNGTTTGSTVIAKTNGSGVASVTLTLPAAKGPVTVTAQSQFAAGGATVTFTETAN